MKKTVATLLIASAVFTTISFSADASNNDLESQKVIVVKKGSAEVEDVEAMRLKSMVRAARFAGSAVKNAWKSAPAGDRVGVTQAFQNAIGLGGIEKSSKNDGSKLNELIYLFDK